MKRILDEEMLTIDYLEDKQIFRFSIFKDGHFQDEYFLDLDSILKIAMVNGSNSTSK